MGGVSGCVSGWVRVAGGSAVEPRAHGPPGQGGEAAEARLAGRWGPVGVGEHVAGRREDQLPVVL